MSEPIWTQVTVAIPAWYGQQAIEGDELRQALEVLDDATYDGETEPTVEGVVAGELWQCSGLANYGLNSQQQSALKRLRDLFVEYDATAEAKYEYPGELRMWRVGWDAERQWEQSAESPVLSQGEYQLMREKHLAQYPADYLGFVEALDAHWPPPTLIAGEGPPLEAAS